MTQQTSVYGRTVAVILTAGLGLAVLIARPSVLPGGKTFTNSVGMNFVRIEPGSFRMGESAARLPEDLLAPLTYHSRSALQKRFPFGDPAQFKVWDGHARFGDFDERPV